MVRADTAFTRLRRKFSVAFSFVAAVIALVIVGGSHLLATYQGEDYKCVVDGPRSTLAVVSEAPGIVEGRYSLWPVGRTCEWLRADGNGTVIVTSNDWITTSILVSLVAFSGLCLVNAVLLSRPQHPAVRGTDSSREVR